MQCYFPAEPPSLSSAPQPRLQLPVDGAVATNNTIITCAASGSREYMNVYPCCIM